MGKMILSISLAFGIVAGLMAYVIAYGEYVHHFPDKRKARVMACESGLIAFLFFVVLGLAMAWVLPHFR